MDVRELRANRITASYTDEPFRLIDGENMLCEDIRNQEIIDQQSIYDYVSLDDTVLEIGARYGSSTIQALKKISNNTPRSGNELRGRFVAIEIDQSALVCLYPNLRASGYTESEKFVSTSALSTQPTLSFVRTIKDNGYASHVQHTQEKLINGRYAEYVDIPTTTLTELKSDHGITSDFNVIIADCEGSFQQIVTDFPDVVGPGTDVVILERDAEFTMSGLINCDYSYIHKYLNTKGLVLCEIRNNYLIYIRSKIPMDGMPLPIIAPPVPIIAPPVHGGCKSGASSRMACILSAILLVAVIFTILTIMIIVVRVVLACVCASTLMPLNLNTRVVNVYNGPP
jgi:hypothetical protein